MFLLMKIKKKNPFFFKIYYFDNKNIRIIFNIIHEQQVFVK